MCACLTGTDAARLVPGSKTAFAFADDAVRILEEAAR